jgi:hypothetical protein
MLREMRRLQSSRIKLMSSMSEETEHWKRFHGLVEEVQARNASVPAEEIEAEIDEALATVRAERFKETP